MLHLNLTMKAAVQATDPKTDLALLVVENQFKSSALFRKESVQSGEAIVTIGYPLAGILSSEGTVTFGHISATAGLNDDPTKLQISAPVQPGNSGGALLDYRGLVSGVVVQKLDAMRVARITGDIPQNVNFAIKGEVAQIFLRAHAVAFAVGTKDRLLDTTELARVGKELTARVLCEGP